MGFDITKTKIDDEVPREELGRLGGILKGKCFVRKISYHIQDEKGTDVTFAAVSKKYKDLEEEANQLLDVQEMGKKGQCICGHMRWKDHRQDFDRDVSLDCKRCDCKQYRVNYKRIRGYFASVREYE